VLCARYAANLLCAL